MRDRKCWSTAAPAASGISPSRSRAPSAPTCSRPARRRARPTSRGSARSGSTIGAMSVENYVAKYSDGRGFDIVYDTVGGTTLDASFNAVAPVRPRRQRARLGHACAGAAVVSRRELFGRVHAAADADGRRPRASRRDPARGDTARGGRQGRPARRSQAFRRCRTSATRYRAVEAGDGAGKIVVDIG